MIQRNVALEARLVDDLLDVTRIRHGKVELMFSPMDVHDAVRQARRGRQARHRCPQPAARRRARRAQRARDGRRDETEAGRVERAQERRQVHAPRAGEIRVTTRNEPGRVVIEVTDTGDRHRPRDADQDLRDVHAGGRVDHAHVTAGSAWASPSPRASSSGTAARSPLTAAASATARPSPSRLPLARRAMKRRQRLPTACRTDHAGMNRHERPLRILVVENDVDTRNSSSST